MRCRGLAGSGRCVGNAKYVYECCAVCGAVAHEQCIRLVYKRDGWRFASLH